MVEGLLRWTEQLDGYLIWYGEGMDEGLSMRESEPEALMTHQVHFLPREGAVLRELISGEEITFPERGLPFSEFVSRPENTWYVRQPPFDFVLANEIPEELDQDMPMLFPRESIRFVLRELEHPIGSA